MLVVQSALAIPDVQCFVPGRRHPDQPGLEEVGLDLYVMAFAFLYSYLLWKRARQRLFIYYPFAYRLGLVVSIGLQMAR
jgi:hypothetical protein